MPAPPQPDVPVSSKGETPTEGAHSRTPALGAVLIFGILTVALVIRIAAMAGAMNVNPMLAHPQNDAEVYWETAERIADGYLIDDKPFLSVPLYPYFLALVRALGGWLTAAYSVQILMHLATAGLIGLLTRRKAGVLAGLAAMVLFLMLEEPAFYALRLMPSALQLLLVVAVLLAADHYRGRGGKGRAVVLGLLTGWLSLIYPPAVVLLPFLVVWMWRIGAQANVERAIEDRGDSTEVSGMVGVGGRGVNGLVCGLLAALTGAAAIAPALLHNYAACGEFIPITAHAGITFRQGNAPQAIGVYVKSDGVSNLRRLMHHDAARVYSAETGRQGSYRRIDRFFFRRGVDYLASDLPRAARLVANKVYWFLTGRHYYDYDHISLERAEGLLPYSSFAPVPTAWLMGPALVGAIMLYRRGRLSGFEAAMLLLPLLIVATFWYSPRYRLPVLPLAVVAAVSAVVLTLREARLKRRGMWRLGLLAVVTAASIATGPLNAASRFDDREGYRPQFEVALAQLYSRIGRDTLALEHFNRADQLRPGNPAVWTGLVNTYIKLGAFDGARQVCEQALAMDPEAPAGWLALGKLKMALEAWEEAEAAFARCLEIDPNNPDARAGRWWSLMQLGRGDEGIGDLLEAVRFNPVDPLTAGGYGIYLAEQGRLEEAETQLRLALRLAPEAPEVRYNLGVVLSRLGRRGEAEVHLRQAILLHPDYAKAKRELEGLVSKAPGLGERIAGLRRRIERRPDSAAEYSALAGLLYAGGDAAGAVAVLRQALDRAQNATTATVELAWLLSTCDDDMVRNGTEAVSLMEGVLSGQPDSPPQFLDVSAAALAQAGRFEEAVRRARQAAETAEQAGNNDLAGLIRERLKLYETGKAFRQ